MFILSQCREKLPENTLMLCAIWRATCKGSCSACHCLHGNPTDKLHKMYYKL